MPLFFFDVANGATETDHVGTVLRDVDQARQEGLRFVANLIAEADIRRDLTARWALIIRDEANAVILRLDIKT